MRTVCKILKVISKTVACLIVMALFAVAATSFSPVYRFRAPAPFTGPDIYNPYRNIDTAFCWKRANFHTHTRVKGLMNECEYWPEEVYAKLEKFGYDIVTFSNHNKLTEHPFDSSLQVNVYEHGYNLFKYHKLVFGSDKVKHRDHLLPMTASQKQFQLDYLGKDSDLIQINHPVRTETISRKQLEKLSGYRLIELDSGRSTGNEYWDWALSAGHYCLGTANDDLHYPDRSRCIAVRCNFLCCETSGYEDIKTALAEGCFYAMRVPDYGRGDWNIKYEKNSQLPSIKHIGLNGSTIGIRLSQLADSIKVTGQNHSTLQAAYGTDCLEYTMKADDSYARITAWFPGGEVIYTNPFARYDASSAESPYDGSCQDISIILTILFNLLAAGAAAGCAYILYKLIKL